ncbi:influenza virus NS1A-binding protein homolog B [Spodoptera frugiperda]|uniref:Kelch-like protein diablo n=1 Tax=Spodoptera frugiperda TaxID=7108 RepID=A0A9R0ER17_SPOFR|nr:influenza virus NS1A-binding protein homolog B [Spodoptera frugiperda]XP_050552118.1 influenza virus NS1A-binding protein homolog B [Spodoptera frugiperda]
MKPHDDYRNGDGGSDSSDSSGDALEDALSLRDDAAPARVLRALNALRKSRQHYDAVLLAGGAELPVHRAVLAAASPYLLQALAALPALPAPAAAPPACRVDDVDADALAALVDYAYTGRLRVRDAAAARRLYRAAWRLRLEPVRAHLAAALLRRLTPHDCLELRALPDLGEDHLATLDAYIAQNFDEVCKSGALATLPLIRIELLRETSAEGGEETAFAVADAALVWLRDRQAVDADLDELCSRTHLLYVDGDGALRDCGELPAARGDAPELQEYRREAAERGRQARRAADAASPGASTAPAPPLQLQLGARTARAAAAVLAATRVAGARTTRALLALRGRLAAARVAWRDVPGGGGVARGGVLGGAREEGGGRRARLAAGRAAHGAAVLGQRLLVLGGYDRARVLRAAEAYDPAQNEWSALPDMRGPRARFPAAVLGDTLYALGGSDGHAELDSVLALAGGRWAGRARLPAAVSHAGAAAAGGALYVVGGWAAGANLKRVLRYDPDADAWDEAPPLNAGRSQCASVCWDGALWALGGCDAWHCLASTERLKLGAGAWEWGPALPTARRAVGAAAWRGRLVVAGGSDGAASLRRTDWLGPDAADAWRSGPALRRPRAALGLAVLEDALYVVGGFDGKEFLSCVECLYAPDGEWTTLLAPPAPRAPLSPASDGAAPDATPPPEPATPDEAAPKAAAGAE